jgi:hypothetical protein
MLCRRYNLVFVDCTSVAFVRLATDNSGLAVQQQSWCPYSTWLNLK